MDITGNQITAAIGLAGINRKELADFVGISSTALSNIETGNTKSPKTITMSRIVQFINMKNVEFIDGGVRTVKSGTRVLNGAKDFKEFIYDVYETVKNGGDICVSNVDERQFERWQGKHAQDYLSKMEKIDGLRFRALIKEGDDYFTANSYAEYRSVPEDNFTGVPTYKYGTKTAQIIFMDNDVSVILTNNEQLSAAAEKQFNRAWKNAKLV